jgi:2,3-bisphosphoglycerate-dependent phosphoglycerate mutase
MDSTRILAIRHGETDWNVDNRIQGQLDIGLNATGRQQARRLARALGAGEPIQAIHASDLSRAHETATAIGQAVGRAVTPHAGLRERGFGDFQGQSFTDIEARWPEAAQRWRRREPDWSPPGGESLAALRDRVLAAVHALAAAHTGELIVLVTHGGVLDQLYRAATGLDLQAPRTWQLANTSVNRLLWTPQGLSLVGWADTSHLDDASLDEAAA